MATSAATLTKILSLICEEYELDEKQVLKQLTSKDLLPAKLISKKFKPETHFASKQAEELATKAKLVLENEKSGSGKDGKWTLTDIKKMIDQPSKKKFIISPIALTFANENGLSVADIKGTGKDGRILLVDVEKLMKSEDKVESNISPRALIVAKENKISESKLMIIHGTGKDGKILLKDIEKIVREESQSESESEDEIVKKEPDSDSESDSDSASSLSF